MESGNETAVHIKKALDAAEAVKAGGSWVHVTLASPKSQPVIVHALGDRTHKLNVAIKPGELNTADIMDMIGKIFLVARCDGKRQPDGGYMLELTLTKPCVIDIACDEVKPSTIAVIDKPRKDAGPHSAGIQSMGVLNEAEYMQASTPAFNAYDTSLRHFIRGQNLYIDAKYSINPSGEPAPLLNSVVALYKGEPIAGSETVNNIFEAGGCWGVHLVDAGCIFWDRLPECLAHANVTVLD